MLDSERERGSLLVCISVIFSVSERTFSHVQATFVNLPSEFLIPLDSPPDLNLLYVEHAGCIFSFL